MEEEALFRLASLHSLMASYSPHLVLFFFLNFWPRCTACRILVPQPGIEPAPPALEGGILTTGLPGKSLPNLVLNKARLCYSTGILETLSRFWDETLAIQAAPSTHLTPSPCSLSVDDTAFYFLEQIRVLRRELPKAPTAPIYLLPTSVPMCTLVMNDLCCLQPIPSSVHWVPSLQGHGCSRQLFPLI